MNTTFPSYAPRPGRMGLAKYAEVLVLIHGEARTHLEVATAMGRNEQTIRELLWRMVHLGIARVAEWVPSSSTSLFMPRFIAGEGDSAPYPKPRKSIPGATLARSNPRPELIHFAAIVRTLAVGATVQELHEATGVAKHRFHAIELVLRPAGLLYVAAWQKNESGHGSPARVLAFGPGKDAPRPKAISQREKMRRYWTRKSAKRVTQMVVDAISRPDSPAQRLGAKPFHLLGKGAAV